MFMGLLKGLLAGIALKLLDPVRQLSLQLLKLEATRAYVQGVRFARLSALGLLVLGLLVGLLLFGGMLVHIALFVLLPWPVETKAKLGLGLGALYLLLGGLAIRALLAERIWLEKSGAAKLIKEALATPAKE